MMGPMLLLQVLDVLLLFGLILRLTRVIVSDDIGLWWVRGPWANYAWEKEGQEFGWRAKISTGLGCPFCVGFWIAGLCLLSLFLVGGPGEAAPLWRWVSAWFALNWIAAHLGARAGDTE